MPTGKAPKKERQDNTPIIQSGVYIFPNGEKYEGEYVKNSSGVVERCGKGKHTFASGMVYSGKWEKDKMNGKGEIRHPSGAVYNGEFVDSNYCGTGVYTWPDSSSYKGGFVDNRMEGVGEFTDSNGHVWVGSFTVNGASGMKLKLK